MKTVFSILLLFLSFTEHHGQSDKSITISKPDTEHSTQISKGVNRNWERLSNTDGTVSSPTKAPQSKEKSKQQALIERKKDATFERKKDSDIKTEGSLRRDEGNGILKAS